MQDVIPEIQNGFGDGNKKQRLYSIVLFEEENMFLCFTKQS